MRFDFLSTAACAIAVAAPMYAQLPTGFINGIAKDATGARVSGVQIWATSESQGTDREGRSNADGSFTLPELQPGAYTVVVASAGFGEVRYAHVQIEAGKVTTLDTTLFAANAVNVDVGTTNAQVDLTQSIVQGQITSSTIAKFR